jgi:hypothetical protein
MVQTKELKFSIGSNEISIQDRYTLIKGKFKRNLIESFKNEAITDLLIDLNLIPFDKFIRVYQGRLGKFKNLGKSLELLDLLEKFNNIITQNIEIGDQYHDFVQSIILVFQLITLLKNKKKLSKELEIAEKFKQSSDLKAITNLLKKLKESMDSNKKKLKYLEEDYLQRKNRYEQFIKHIDDYASSIQDLTVVKKRSFSQINKITRQMSGNSINQKEESEGIEELDKNLTNAQKIRVLQNKAKEAQIKIQELRSNLDEVKLKFEEFNPLYQTYRQDYNNLIEVIKNDENKIEELNLKLRDRMKESEEDSYQMPDEIDLKSIRSPQEVEEALNSTITELNSISIPNNLINSQNPEDLSLLIAQLNQINKSVNALGKNVKLSKKESEYEEIFDSFQKLETIIFDLENLINRFLIKINLKSHFQVLLSNDNQRFLIRLNFTRNNKEKLTFDKLTTPEKIFFIIICNISIEIQLENNNIIFSNLFIPSNYNKAGSIFRTIRKILPFFENDDFAEFNLIFILSNLELKKEIKNLKIITIQENE